MSMIRCTKVFQQILFAGLLALAAISTVHAGGGGACGDSMLDPGEICDDGNTTDGDGCSASCTVETGFECTDPYVPSDGFNYVLDPGFEDGLGTNNWNDQSTQQLPNICNLIDCPDGPGARYGAHWLQFGNVSSPAAPVQWDVSQDVFIESGAKFLRFDVQNFQCSEPGLPDFFSITLDSNLVWLTNEEDPACFAGNYRTVTINLDNIDGGPYDDDNFHVLSIGGQTIFEENRIAFDNIEIFKQGDPSQPSVCTLKNEVQLFSPFEGIGGELGPPDFFQQSVGETTLKWGTTDDNVCGTGESPPGNHTGGPGEAACADSTAVLRGGQLPIETYFCHERIDLSFRRQNVLDLTVNYQPGNTTAADFFGVWVDTQPYLGPISGGTGSPQLFVNQPIGNFGQAPGQEIQLDISAFDLTPDVFVCFGYGNDGQGYAQVDSVRVTSGFCTDDFEKDKLDSCNDNCILLPNPGQEDSDGDGYGNMCDGDIKRDIILPEDIVTNGNDCLINFLDFAVFVEALFTTPLSENWNPDADFSGDGTVNFIDMALFVNMFMASPGPSGLTTACGAASTRQTGPVQIQATPVSR